MTADTGTPPTKGVITFTHSYAEGTLIEGSRKGDGVWEILLELRRNGQGNWKSFRSLGQLGLGQSRDKPPQQWKIDKAAEALRAAGWTVEIEIDPGGQRSTAEIEADRYQRAEDRTWYHEEQAGRASAASDAAYRAEHAILDVIPAGQPVLRGHHSEGRHRRDLDRADGHRRRGWAEADRAGYHTDRAGAAGQYQERRESVPTTLRRIQKLEADLRGVQRDLDGAKPAGGRYYTASTNPATGGHREQLLARKERLEADIAYWKKHVEKAGVKVWGPGDFTRGDFARSRGHWWQVLKINPKTITVPDGANTHLLPVVTPQNAEWADSPGEPSGGTRTIPYDNITHRVTASEMAGFLAEAERRRDTELETAP